MLSTCFIILEQTYLHIPLIVGAYVSISLMKLPDLSIESAYVFGAIIGAQTIGYTQALPLSIQLIIALLASIIGGTIVGIVSSLLTQKARIPHLLSSIMTIGLFHGINQLVLGTYLSLGNKANPLTIVAMSRCNPELPMLGIIAGITLYITYFLLPTQLGHAFATYGDNPSFFGHYNINTNYIFSRGIIISNALAGISGYLFAQSNGFVEIGIGVGKPLLCITALILGKTLLRIQYTVSLAVPLIGCVAYFTLQQLLLKVGFNLKYFTAVQACLVLLVLIIRYRKNSPASGDHLGV